MKEDFMVETKREEGFTLIELMIVVAIIGILAAIAIPQFSAYRAKAFNSAAESDLRNLMTAEEAYVADNQTYTATQSLLGNKTSQNVVLTVDTASSTDYHASSYHTSGNKTYTVTGTVGVIQSH
jgi:type IV pilus assembly protein PilA